MSKIISLLLFLLVLVATNANAWFFFYIPSGSFDQLSDAITGSEGENCVGQNAKVGDIISLSSGITATIKSLSGTSTRCTRPEFPIRALLGYTSTSKTGINLSDEWEPKPLWSRQIISGGILLAQNHASDSVSYLYISAIKRESVPDMQVYATNVRTEWAKSLPLLQQFKGGAYISNSNVAEESMQTEIEQITINGMRAWRFEVTGKRKGEFSIEFTYLITILEGTNEIVQVNTWTTVGTFQKQREAFKQLAVNVSGIEPPSSPAVVAPSIESTKEDAPPKVSAVVAPGNLPVSATPSTPPSASPVVSTPSPSSLPTQSGNAASRLRELNQLYKDGVINKNDFEAKKQEILKSM